MPYGLYISAEGAQAQQKRMEVIANNLANVDTTGFKRQLATVQSRYAEAIEQGLDHPGSGSINDVGGGVQMIATQTDFSKSPLKQTGGRADLAIDADGVFFKVLKGDQEMLTRAGNFTVRSNGDLVTQQGYQVLSTEGRPVRVDPLQFWEITPEGAMRQNGGATPLAMVTLESLSQLVNVGENLFEPLAPTVDVPLAGRGVKRGYLEASGVEPTREMMEMIETSRAFEANVNLIRLQDQVLGTYINRALRTS
ncbi:MAG: flagellar hook basal-body protein [Planctomycetales bacterium]|nr:flagellar hook basal-body protein [Planctomycetales bacterium]